MLLDRRRRGNRKSGLVWVDSAGQEIPIDDEARPFMDANTTTLLLLPLMVVAFYFLLIRPQRKRAQAQQKLLAEMQPGERVVTHSGIFGTLVSVGPKQSVLQIAPGVEITVLKQAVARVVGPADEDGNEELDETETGDSQLDEVETESAPSAGAAGVAGATTAATAESAYDPYRPGEPSSHDLPADAATTSSEAATSSEPTAPSEPFQDWSAEPEPADGGIRDVTTSYFSRPDGDDVPADAEAPTSSGTAGAGESETGRPTKDS
jgi:preprotein translocase subunit YajC